MTQRFTQPEVRQRDLHFDFGDADVTDWHPAGKQVSLFFAALSPFFPEGEKFFIRSVRRFADDIDDPALQRNVKGFIGQEAMHGREHREYNERLCAAGLPADKVERFVIKDLKFVERTWSARARLAITAALEHFTAIMASLLLREPRALAGGDERIVALWRWHAIEETEHKAVAFDLYQQVAPGLTGYLRRCGMMLISSFFFVIETLIVHLIFCHRAGCLWDLRGWARFFWYFWGRPGMYRRILIPWLSYFRPGFHPWDDDNREAIARWQAASAAQ